MTATNKLTLSGLVVGAALTSSGCVSYQQHQDELAQVRAELSALKAEIQTLKGGAQPTADAPSPSQTAAAADASQVEEQDRVSPPADPEVSLATWEEALKKHNDEPRDLTWSRTREPDLFALAKTHIKPYGASLNGVRCKTSSCLITINVPKDPKVAYEPLSNPWAQTQMLSHHKSIYSGRTLWSYLLERHDKDTKEAGAERVNPLELAQKNPELVKPSVLVGASSGTQLAAAQPHTAGQAAPTAQATPAAAAHGTPSTQATPAPSVAQRSLALTAAKPAGTATSAATPASTATTPAKPATTATTAAKPAATVTKPSSTAGQASQSSASQSSAAPSGQAAAKTAAQATSSKPTSPLSNTTATNASTKTTATSGSTTSKASSTASSAATKTTTPQNTTSASAAQATQKQAAASSSSTKTPASR
jgi:hypothetical protein